MSFDLYYTMLPDETPDAYLLRLGRLKEEQQINATWADLAVVFNHTIGTENQHTESYWRKKYHDLTKDTPKQEENPAKDWVKEYFQQIEKQRVRVREERTAYGRAIRSQARTDEILQLFQSEIKRYQDHVPSVTDRPAADEEKAMYVMLSDIHYGVAFDSAAGKYNTDIAKQRLQLYAQQIKEHGVACSSCYVSLMGDMISGNIHTSIRVENRETVIEQVIGVSELVAEFLYDLSSYFDHVYVNSTSGNHSRMEASLENALRKERLDAIVPWYCAARLEHVHNIYFVPNTIDDTIGSFYIFDKQYVSVHGDYEKDVKTSVQRIMELTGEPVYCFLSAHTHVASMYMDHVFYLANGCVCGSGDDYSMKNRLFCPPSQVCFICGHNGVEAVYPVDLSSV